jgi:hypothetical protein
MFLKARTHQPVLTSVFIGAAVMVVGSNADAVIVQQMGNSGWEAVWDDSFGSGPGALVSINTLSVDFNAANGEGAVFFQKSAEFTQGPVNGIFPSIPIVFRQIAGWTGPTVRNLVIDDEIITNSTGAHWSDFHFDLLDHGEVWFDPARTAASGGGGPIGFSIDPFTNATFSNFVAPNQPMRLDIFGGPGIASGTQWFPGDGANDGQLWIHVSALTGSTLFVLKETPTPAPGALALLGVGLMLGGGRRRRS